ncbi:hypothetical protein ASE01_09485 [Nocardioides sp. Root190]|uniref:hypothetical protein n=1 Tax=Nocardioides sp. Root190 TaxID=1736488 RepID=UPI0006F87F91|nr:hypothetical protein [Nocardioides sp. Root190]KRB76988.1 hypothetical protein ASE01_09485 [Nocardioides sp. Root190]
MASTFEKVQAAPVLATVRRLEQRIEARFPGRGLHRVVGELASLVETVASSTASVRGRRSWLRTASRIGIVVVLAATTTLVVLALRAAAMDAPDELEWVPLVESAVNDLIFAVLAIWFLWSVPERLQRNGLLELLHRLRSMAHIVDMHQLTKDPERLRASFAPTPQSVAMDLSPTELEYYLDYCSELLSLIGKAAALCAEESSDAVVLETVSTVETLTVSLERKIWQKIAVLNATRDQGPAS